MSKSLYYLIIFLLINNCSLNQNSKFWSEENTDKVNKKEKDIKSKFLVNEAKENEINTNSVLKIDSSKIKINELYKLNNNYGQLMFDGKLEILSKYKFSKIDSSKLNKATFLSYNNDLVFFDDKGNIIKYDKTSKVIWKKNFYEKLEKKSKPFLKINNKKNILIVIDNISKLYAIDLIDGSLIWTNKNIAPFNSQIKIYKDKFFVVDFQNTLRCYSIKNGKELWNIKTNDTFIKSNKEISIVVIKDKLFFNNSLGDITAVDINKSEILWQLPTQNSLIFDNSFTLRNSEMISDANNLYFSNNRNQFFSIDINNGIIKWKKKVNSDLTPTLINDYVFTISLGGYLKILNKHDGKIIKSVNIFKSEQDKKKFKRPSGFIIGKNKIYLSLNNGKLLSIDLKTGKILSTKKIDNKKISRPFVINKNMFVIKDNAIIKLN